MEKKLNLSLLNNSLAIENIELDKTNLKIYLNDKRIILFPLSQFPEIKRLKPSQKKSVQIINHDGDQTYFSFKGCDTIFKITNSLFIVRD